MPRREYDDEDRLDRRDDDEINRRDKDPYEDRYSGRPRPRSDRDDSRPRRRDDDFDDDWDDDDDYEFRRRRRRGYEEHRGTLILVLGICGLVVCGLCAPAAWIMGGQDLAKMRDGIMDKEGYGSTQAGYVLGIIGTLLIFAVILIVIVIVAAGK